MRVLFESQVLVDALAGNRAFTNQGRPLQQKQETGSLFYSLPEFMNFKLFGRTILVVQKQFGNEPLDSLQGNHRGWFVGIPLYFAENKQV